MAVPGSPQKMVVKSMVAVSSSDFKLSAARLELAGYPAPATLQRIHCNTQSGCEALTFMENGFVQTFIDVDGRSARVMDYAPSQTLQPHCHDIDELFEIRGGSVLVSKWPNGLDGERVTATLRAGDELAIPKGVVHALRCDAKLGLQFHETVGTGDEAFAKRETVFCVDRGYAQA